MEIADKGWGKKLSRRKMALLASKGALLSPEWLDEVQVWPFCPVLNNEVAIKATIFLQYRNIFVEA